MIEMELLGVQVELPSNSPLLLLRETEGQGRVLPVVIDTPEAHAIHRGIEGIRLARPLTHDLLVTMLEELQATIIGVVVTELRERTFFAEIEIQVGGEARTISARPSDAIAIAVRT
ncbi:MAG TPA: bifunctional nuclease family protein, partial [Acidimicrobiales bacterium]|nr:bifunctional nuclease family protein [Acidimicrobiales bacterium]